SKTYSKGCELAEGVFICPLAHDDELVPTALETAKKYIHKYDANDVAGVAGRCIDEKGHLIGKPVSIDIQIVREGIIRYKQRNTAELLNITKKSILEKYVQDLQKGVTEGVVYAKIAEKYKYIFVNDIFRIYSTHV